MLVLEAANRKYSGAGGGGAGSPAGAVLSATGLGAEPVSKALCQVTDGEPCSVVLLAEAAGLPAQRFALVERQPPLAVSCDTSSVITECTVSLFIPSEQ